MTHDKLLIKLLVMNANESEQTRLSKTTQALRVIVEMHKPITTPNNFSYCPECQYGHARGVYPCPTIQAIEKELS